ncbi:MAG: AMP-binding protein [Candidatus Solibacter usitatus]|nr:AMP-binding protein [Candidatus Solibacter usitatus]
MAYLQCTLAQYENEFRGRHLIHDAMSWWAERKPAEPAIINATRDTVVDWATLDRVTRALAGELLRRGFRKGDFLATSLPLLNEHIFLEYACFRIGVIHVPLDLRLSPAELIRCLSLVRAKGYATALAFESQAECPFIEQLWNVDELKALFAAAMGGSEPVEWPEVAPTDGAQVIFTTGSTGRPKAALLTHRSITSQNLCLGAAFEFDASRALVNLPPSHVGCQAELLMSIFFWGGTAVTLELFDPGKSLEAIEKYKVRLLGQIPAMSLMEWRHSEWGKRDLSSLEIAVYGGQAVPRPFLEKLRTMAPRIATGLGLTETSGFCTYTAPSGDVDAVAAGIGFPMPIYGMTIRNPMKAGGAAGDEVAAGEIGHVCFNGPQTFAGYVNDPEATAAALSSDGHLYTGDMGRLDAAGLHFAGRSKWVIKPAGFQVFPGDVENHLAALSDKVASSGVVGVEHPIWVEAIVAFVEKRPGVDLTAAELRRHARGLTSYMRPLHYVIVEPGQLPLNRVAKVDTLKLKEMAEIEVAQLRARGRWQTETEGED